MKRPTDTLPDALVDVVAALLAQLHGLRTTAATQARLESSIRERAVSSGLDPERYVAGLSADTEELQAIVDLVTVQETSFFRDGGHLDALRWHVAAKQPEPIVVWSAGCATGQEPYSIAFALDEAGVSDWRVVATDLSRAAVQRTKEGRYHRDELRGLSAARRCRYLRPDGDRWRVEERIRERVTVIHHNLLTDPVPLGIGEAAALFCRNVLIYVDRDRIDPTLRRIRPHLRAGAVVFVGGSESLPRVPDGFRLDRLGNTFVYRTATDDGLVHPAPRRAAAPTAAIPATAPPPRAPAHDDAAPGDATAVDTMAIDATPLTPVEQHRRSVCLDPDDPLAHLQLGLALQAAGDPDAGRRAFRAALAALGRADPRLVEPRLEGYGIDALRSLLDAKVAEGSR